MIVDVALPIPVGKSFSYIVPGELTHCVRNLSRVLVPFHNKETVGVAMAVREGDGAGLKEVIDVIDAFPLVDDELSALLEWSSSHYVTPRGLVFKYALPAFRDLERFLAVETTAGGPSEMNGAAFRKAVRSFGRKKILQLYNDGLLRFRDTLTDQVFSTVPAQSVSVCPDSRNIKVLLIDSVENRLAYYGPLISEHLGGNGNVMFLLPDYYAAGAYFAKKLKEGFGQKVLWYGSGVSVKQRMETFFRVRRECGNVILGNKSSVFLPIHNLSLVIVERYEDDEYRNEVGFKFNPVRLAIKRAQARDISIVLASGACSVDLGHLAGGMGFKTRRAEWLTGNQYNERTDKKGSRSTGEALERIALEVRQSALNGMRVAVYTPRKDHGGFLRCHACREPLLCPKCDGYLSYDRIEDVMICSHCTVRFPYKGICPSCGSSMIGFSRTGVGFIEEHLRKAAPGLHIVRVTGDSLKKEISAIRKLPADEPAVLVGTQSLSKLYGFHVDRLILAGWEELRKMGGHRAEEKAHQIIVNLVDALTPSEIISFPSRKEALDPRNYFDIGPFFEKELRKRKDADFPPFVRIFLIHVRKKTKNAADSALKKIRGIIYEEGLGSSLFGTIPLTRSPFHIWRVVMKGDEQLLHEVFRKLYDIQGVEVEADPVGF